MIDTNLPLVDLHRHLDGNIRPSTIWQLANEHNIQLPTSTFEQFLPFVKIEKSEPDLVSFLSKLDWGVAVLATLDDCKRIAFENVEDAFNAGIDYAELRFSPFYMAMKHQLPISGVVEAVIDGINQGIQQFDIDVNLIGILSRTFGVDQCMTELNALLQHKEKLVAIDLAGDEAQFPGELFNEHFNKVKQADLNITIHAGEALGSQSVWQAINELGATRIGHGVASINDEKLLDYIIEKHISIESCITSNFQTGTVASIKEHPIKSFLEKGVSVCLNTDDPAVEGIELQHEYAIAKTLVGLSNQQLSTLQRNGVNASFLSQNEKRTLLAKQQFNHQR